MDFALGPELEALAADARAVGRSGADRRRFKEDGWLVGHDRAFARELAVRGWIGMTWPREVGGGGRPPLERFVVYEALIGEGAPLASSYFADRQVGPTLLQFASPEQIERWVPGILSGTSMWCIGLSEPDAGSDVAAIRTRAVVDDGATGTSPARRSGPAAPPMPTGATSSPAPTSTRPRTRASPSSSSTCALPGSRSARSSTRPAIGTSARCTSRTWSCPATT